MTEYPQDIVKTADDVCRSMDIASTTTNCLPIMDAILAERERCNAIVRAAWGQNVSIEAFEAVMKAEAIVEAHRPPL